MDHIKTFLRREWSQLSTKWGAVIGALTAALEAIQNIAPAYAPFDRRFAWLGATASIILIVWRGKPRD